MLQVRYMVHGMGFWDIALSAPDVNLSRFQIHSLTLNGSGQAGRCDRKLIEQKLPGWVDLSYQKRMSCNP